MPHLRIVRGKKDITKMFQHSTSSDIEGAPGLQINKFTSVLISNTFSVSEDWRGETLKCVAKVPRWSDLRQVETAQVEVICKFYKNYVATLINKWLNHLECYDV